MGKTVPETGHNFVRLNLSLKGRHAGLLFFYANKEGSDLWEDGGKQGWRNRDVVYRF